MRNLESENEDVEMTEEQKEYIESVLNWTLPGLTFYYRDADLDVSIQESYPVGAILRAGFFIDMTTKAQKPCHNVRFIIASAHAANVHETDMCEPFMKECKLAVLHPNSYFKVLDIYKVGEQTQVFLLHIPMHGVSLFQNVTSFNFVIEDQNYDDYFIQLARKSFDDKLQMEPREVLETDEWLDRTMYPIGLMADNSPFPLEYSTYEQCIELEIALRKMGEDTDAINLPVFDDEESDD